MRRCPRGRKGTFLYELHPRRRPESGIAVSDGSGRSCGGRSRVCRVIDAFVDGLAMAELGFERAEAADTGRPGYNPRDLLKLYLYGYLHQLRSSRRPEAECATWS
jgi:hypothetical protein